MEDFSKYNEDGTILRKAQMRLLEMLVEVDRICKKYKITYWIDGGTTLGARRHDGFIPWDDDVDITVLRKDYFKLIKILKKELPEKYAIQNQLNEKFFHYMHTRVVDQYSLSDFGNIRQPFRKKFKHQGLFLDIFYVEKGILPVKRIISRIYYRSFFYKRNLSDSKLRKILSLFIWPFISLVVFILRFFSFLIPANYLIFGYGIPFPREFRRNEILPTKTMNFEGYNVMGPNDVDGYLKRYFGDYMKIPPKDQQKTHAERIEVYDTK